MGEEGGGGKGLDGGCESVFEVAGVAAEVDEDGEGDGVVAFDLELGWVEDGAGVEADVESFARDGGDGAKLLGEDEGGDLDEVGVDVEGVGGGVWRWGSGAEAEC